jgi:hypothetical protein
VFQGFGLPAPKRAVGVASVTTAQQLHCGEDIPGREEEEWGREFRRRNQKGKEANKGKREG